MDAVGHAAAPCCLRAACHYVRDRQRALLFAETARAEKPARRWRRSGMGAIASEMDAVGHAAAPIAVRRAACPYVQDRVPLLRDGPVPDEGQGLGYGDRAGLQPALR